MIHNMNNQGPITPTVTIGRGDVDKAENFFACRTFFLICNVCLLLGSIGELITSIFVISYSGAWSIGGLYTAIVCFLTSISSFYLPTRKWVLCDMIFLIVCVICCVVSTAILIATSKYVYEIEACANYTGDSNTSCSAYSSNIHCYGNSDYYVQAKVCAADYYYHNGDDENVCSCAKRDDTDTCYEFTHVPNCERFVELLPGATSVCLVFSIILLIISIIMLMITSISYCCKGKVCCFTFANSNTGYYENPELTQGLIANASAPPVAELEEGASVITPRVVGENYVMVHPEANPVYHPYNPQQTPVVLPPQNSKYY
jgi:hypothetical protein